MESTELPQVTLETIGDGAAMELFQEELDKVLENVLDPNTKADAVRVVTLKVQIKPTEDRDLGAVIIQAQSTMAPTKGQATTIYIGRRGGRAIAVEQNAKQMRMDWDAESKPTAIVQGQED